MLAPVIFLLQTFGTLLSLIRNKNKCYGLAVNRICKEICIFFKPNTCIYLSLIRKNFEFWKFYIVKISQLLMNISQKHPKVSVIKQEDPMSCMLSIF
jgi:hypothetical protein